MLSLDAPLWLLGIALLPAIRWLHRGGRHRRAVAVSHLALWQGAAAINPAAGQRQPPDPAWRRRALFAALLFIALAGPQWAQRNERITLWIDDSLSMLTRETQGTRLAEGAAQMHSALARYPGADVEVRTLGDPWRSRDLLDDAAVSAIAVQAARIGRQSPEAPPAALLRNDRLHWLLTDGSDARRLDWPEGRRPDRLFQVAGVTRNVGLQRLSARRNTGDPDRLDLQLELSNGGNATETRVLVVSDGSGELARATRQLEPGASARVNVSVPAATLDAMAPTTRLRARLEPGDALAEDDEIAIDLAALRKRRVAVDSTCPRTVIAAAGAHPALTMVPADAGDLQAALDCGSLGAAAAVPTIQLRTDRAPARARGLLQWSPSVAEQRRFGLAAARLQFAATLQAGPQDSVLLAAGGDALIVARAGSPRRIDTALDFEAMALAPGPDVPLLLNLMLEQLFGARLLGELAIAERAPAASVVVPSAKFDASAGAASGARDAAAGSAASAASAAARADGAAQTADAMHTIDDQTRPLLVLALIVLLWELVALGRQWARLTHHAQSP